MNLLDLALSLALLPALAACAYLGLLALASRRERPPLAQPPHLRFDLVVPAHDEEANIAETVASLRQLDYPAELFRILVVADNCGDTTAERARAAGARVLTRDEPTLRGKGYALARGFEDVERDDFCDAVVVVDADTSVDRHLLRAFSARLERGAKAVQAEYQVRGDAGAWRVRLLSLALALFHTTRSLGRERLGLSCGLRGNGMCFTRELLRAVPHRAFSIVEDVEYGIRLGRAGVRVIYAAEAGIRGEMPSGERAARSQRRRWEGGRRTLARTLGLPLLREAIAHRDPVRADLAMDLLVPPLSQLVGALALSAAACVVLALVHLPLPVTSVELALALGLIVVYVVRGWWLSRSGLRGLAALARAPLYLLWRLTVAFRSDHTPRGAWVRTPRDVEARR